MHDDINVVQQIADAPAVTPFEIDSAQRANWLLRKLLESRAYGAKARAFAEREQRRAIRDEQWLMHLFGRQLEAWVANEIAARGGRVRSVSLPAGTTGHRRVGPRLVIDDGPVVLAWAKQHMPNAVVTTPRLSKKALTEEMQRTGVIPSEGAHVEAAGERFYIR